MNKAVNHGISASYENFKERNSKLFREARTYDRELLMTTG